MKILNSKSNLKMLSIIFIMVITFSVAIPLFPKVQAYQEVGFAFYIVGPTRYIAEQALEFFTEPISNAILALDLWTGGGHHVWPAYMTPEYIQASNQAELDSYIDENPSPWDYTVYITPWCEIYGATFKLALINRHMINAFSSDSANIFIYQANNIINIAWEMSFRQAVTQLVKIFAFSLGMAKCGVWWAWGCMMKGLGTVHYNSIVISWRDNISASIWLCGVATGWFAYGCQRHWQKICDGLGLPNTYYPIEG